MIFQILRGDYVEFYVDAMDERRSNWLRWINCSRNDAEENVEWYECAGKIYLMTRKDVYPGQELLFYYGDDYAEGLGINYRLPETEFEDDEDILALIKKLKKLGM